MYKKKEETGPQFLENSTQAGSLFVSYNIHENNKELYRHAFRHIDYETCPMFFCGSCPRCADINAKCLSNGKEQLYSFFIN